MDSSTQNRSALVAYFTLVTRPRRELAFRKPVLLAIALSVYLSLMPFIVAGQKGGVVPATPQQASINFDNLATNSIVANQYSQLHFSATGFSGGQGGPQGYDVWTQSNFGSGGSTPNAIFSTYNPSFTNSGYARGQADLYLDFTQPVNNLSFSLLNVHQTTLYAWVYVNRLFYGYYTLNFNGGGSLVRVNNFSGIQNITGIQLKPYNWHPVYSYLPLYYDDFTFFPTFDVRITNTRVSGSLNGTTQNALVGADILLSSNVVPSQTGGTYAWTFAGQHAVSGPLNTSSVTVRATDVGTITANVSYTNNGFKANGTVTINAVLPSLTSFTGQQSSDRVSMPGTCGSPDSYWWYKLGCGSQDIGMSFLARVHAPSFISDPTQSGVKYVQAVSAFRKKNQVGLRCATRRSTESDIASGWQLDADPYLVSGDVIHRFSEGSDLTATTVDYPGNRLSAVFSHEFSDVLYVDDRFEMYVVYFGGTSATPMFQRALGKLAWNWGGLVVLDWNGSDSVHHIRYSNSSPGARTGTATSAMVSMQGNVSSSDVPCPGGPPLTNNNIDSSRVFVKYHYLDFLNRNPETIGWNFWTSTISQCIFDPNCIHSQRVGIGLAFFYSGEFIQTDPDMANPPGSPGFNAPVYNRRFVYWCYQKYLHVDPTGDTGWDFWANKLNSTGDYGNIIDAFQLSGDYRDREFF